MEVLVMYVCVAVAIFKGFEEIQKLENMHRNAISVFKSFWFLAIT